MLVKPSIWGITRDELAGFSVPIDSRVFCTRLVRGALGHPRAEKFGSETLQFLEEHFDTRLPSIATHTTSSDGSTKYVIALSDGAKVETVFMPRAVKNPRVTVCLSSQVGCAMGCTFCHTATMGLVRHMTTAEIVGQLVSVLRAAGHVETDRVNVVFMGMGEPLHNFNAVTKAIEIMCEPSGLGLHPNRITISTSGLVPQIDALAAVKVRPTLAISLNATSDEKRLRTMPITKTHGIAALREAALRFPLRPHEKITIEYVLLENENDSEEDAKNLAAFVLGFRHHVNVIAYNAFDGSLFSRPKEDAVDAFVKIARAHGCLVTVRKSRGRDVAAACGQLVQEGRRKKLRMASPNQ